MTIESLPHWDMSVVYPSLDAPELGRDFGALLAEIERTVELFDKHAIAKRAPSQLDDTTVAAFEQVVDTLNGLLERAGTLGAYIYSFIATDSRDTLAQAKLSEYQQAAVKL